MNFRDMTSEQRREMARRGGRRAQSRGTGRRWTTEQATAAARLSAAVRRERQAAAWDRSISIMSATEPLPSLRCPDTLLAFDGPEVA